MDPEEWEKHWLEFEKRMAEIDAIYKWKVHLIARQQRLGKFFLTGYVVLMITGIVFTNWIVAGFGALCALACILTGVWMAWQIRTHPYPGGKG